MLSARAQVRLRRVGRAARYGLQASGRILRTFPRAIDKLVGHATPGLAFWLTLIVNAGVLSAIWWLYRQPPLDAHFSADVLTESVIVDIPRNGQLPQHLAVSALPIDATGQACTPSTFEFYKPVEQNLRFTFSAIGKKPSVLIEPVPKPVDDTPYAFVSCSGKRIDVSKSARAFPFQAPDAQATFTLEGRLQLGQVAAPDATGLLRSGQVIVATYSLPSPSARIEQRTDLMLGDEVRFFEQSDGARQPSAITLIRYDTEKHAFNVVTHAAALSAEVKRPGFETAFPITVAPTIWARLEAQSEWAMALVVFTLVLNILMAIRTYAAANGVQIVEIRQ